MMTCSSTLGSKKGTLGVKMTTQERCITRPGPRVCYTPPSGAKKGTILGVSGHLLGVRGMRTNDDSEKDKEGKKAKLGVIVPWHLSQEQSKKTNNDKHTASMALGQTWKDRRKLINSLGHRTVRPTKVD